MMMHLSAARLVGCFARGNEHRHVHIWSRVHRAYRDQATFHPDCVVLDVHMPGMNGLEVQELLAQSETPLPVIFITAHDEASVRERTLQAGAVAFLPKPFDGELFV